MCPVQRAGRWMFSCTEQCLRRIKASTAVGSARHSHRLRRFWSAALSTRGQATIEAAFALPILMLLILLLLQPGVILYDRIVMQGAAAEGCRLLATADDSSAGKSEDYIRRRLSAIPQVDFFHVHSSGCSWQISLSGNENAPSASVKISTEIKPLPLIGLGAGFLGATNANGNLVIEVEASSATQPSWYWQSSA